MPDIPGNASTNRTIAVGDSVVDTLETVGDRDWFRIELNAGQAISVFLDGITLEDPYLRIRDASGNIIYENDDISLGVNRDSLINFTANYTGTYYIDVGSWNDGYAGDYNLQVTTYVPPPVWNNDQIADQLVDGYWFGESHSFNVSQGGSISVNITALTADGQHLAREALALWSDIIGITFNEVATGGQIIFDDDEEGAFAEADWANGVTTTVNVNVSTQWLVDYGTSLNSYSFQTYIHEIGHALGLGHAGHYNGDATYPYNALFANDAWATTVMSYFSQTENDFFRGQGFTENFLGTPMVADIIAIGELYGLSTTTRTGDTTYGFNSNAGRQVYNAAVHPNIAYTVFDSGGVDTLDYSGFSNNQRIDLNPESFSNVGGNVGNVSIARDVVIENAIGGSGRDSIFGNAASNRLTGNAGNDMLDGGDGNDRLDGGTGVDTASYATSRAGVSVSLAVAAGQDTIGAGVDTLVSIENLSGSAFGDQLTGSSAANTILGRDGDDVLMGAGGDDFLDGGEGSDTYAFGSVAEYLSADISDGGSSGIDDLRFSATNAQSLTLRAAASGLERIVLTGAAEHRVDASNISTAIEIFGNAGANILIGSHFADRLDGGGGDDGLYGEDGDDRLDGGDGLNRMFGGIGNDTYVVHDSDDYVLEAAGEGIDTVYSDVTHYLRANVEELRLTGSAAVTGVGNEGANVIVGNSGLNRLYGRDGDDRLYGNDGNDRLDGGAGVDRMFGGESNDVYVARDSTDFAFEYAGQGIDTVYSSVTHALRANVENLRLTGNSASNGIGSDDGNAIVGNSAANSIAGRGGNDRMWGQGGDDRLFGDSGADTMRGGDGDDVLDGGSGRDHYYGNAGADLFVFRDGDFASTTTQGTDRILDFGNLDGDRIHLSAVDANTGLAGDQGFAFIGGGSFTGNAGELRYEQIEGSTYVSGDTNGDGVADFMIRVDGLHTFGDGDFIL